MGRTGLPRLGICPIWVSTFAGKSPARRPFMPRKFDEEWISAKLKDGHVSETMPQTPMGKIVRVMSILQKEILPTLPEGSSLHARTRFALELLVQVALDG